MAETPPLLLADVGGTNARFALLPSGTARPEAFRSLELDRFPGVGAAAAAYLAAACPAVAPAAALLAVAGPVSGNAAALTNRGWTVDGTALAAELGLASARVVNDFAALAWSLPHLGAEDLHPLGGGAPEPGAPLAVLGPGTGLGVACHLPGPPPRVLATEGGHVTLAAADAGEAALLERLREALGPDAHVSAERALSGPGLEALHRAHGGPPLPAAAVLEAALAGPGPARAALDTFCAVLGGLAGNLALTYGARGGVFVGGGIAPRFPDFLAASAFRTRFEAKGRFAAWLAPVPTWLITRPDAALVGLAALARFG